MLGENWQKVLTGLERNHVCPHVRQEALWASDGPRDRAGGARSPICTRACSCCRRGWRWSWSGGLATPPSAGRRRPAPANPARRRTASRAARGGAGPGQCGACCPWAGPCPGGTLMRSLNCHMPECATGAATGWPSGRWGRFSCRDPPRRSEECSCARELIAVGLQASVGEEQLEGKAYRRPRPVGPGVAPGTTACVK